MYLSKRNALVIPTVSLTRQMPSCISGKSSTALIPVLCSLGPSVLRLLHPELRNNVVLAVLDQMPMLYLHFTGGTFLKCACCNT